MKSFSITLTDQQGVALVQLIDLATKAGGMGVARAAVELDNIIRAGAQSAIEQETLKLPDAQGK